MKCCSLHVEIWFLKELRSLPAAALRFDLELRFHKQAWDPDPWRRGVAQFAYIPTF